MFKKLLAVGIVAGGVAAFAWPRPLPIDGNPEAPLTPWPEKREKQLSRLKQEDFDILIIGGGATGSGAALDASLRGYRVALVERADFASGTSSKSTKLIHGGVRYLEKAFLEADIGQLELVHDALHERSNWFRIAPHLSSILPIVTPVYQWWQLPYVAIGMFMYDVIAAGGSLKWSSIHLADSTRQEFPTLSANLSLDNNSKEKAVSLKGSVVYADGQMNDSRMAVSLALTAAAKGAAVSNYTEVIQLLDASQFSSSSSSSSSSSATASLKEKRYPNGPIAGALVRDVLTGQEFIIKAKTIINATGPYSDTIRKLDDSSAKPFVLASSGVHLILDSKLCPPDKGLLIPKTADGRVLFILPWEGKTLVGTTDEKSEIVDSPTPNASEIDYLLKYVSTYLDVPVQRSDVLSAWSGLRPLALDPAASSSAKGTAAISRDHLIQVSKNGLISIAGGKWTTYRKMAEDVIQTAVSQGKLSSLVASPSSLFSASSSSQTRLIGAERYTRSMAGELKKTQAASGGVDEDVLNHLVHSYGDRAKDVLELSMKQFGSLKRLHPQHPYLAAEAIYGTKYEQAMRVSDVLARRTRLAFLDAHAALECVESVADMMGQELKWNSATKKKEIAEARKELLALTGLDKIQYGGKKVDMKK